MKWYYALNGSQQGPVEEAELKRLHAAGLIQDGTLVWREGLEGWLAFARAMPPAPAAYPPPPPPASLVAPPLLAGATAGVRCAGCGREFPPEAVLQLPHGLFCAGCKPLAVQKLREGVTDSGAESIRKEHLKHEASILSAGLLYWLGAISSIGAGVAVLALGTSVDVLTAVLLVAMAVVAGFAGYGVRRLRPWGRVMGIALSVMGLFALGLGTIINIYILYLLMSKKGRTIFSPEYRQVIAATPHIKYRTSIIGWICLILLLLLFVGLVLPFLVRINAR